MHQPATTTVPTASTAQAAATDVDWFALEPFRRVAIRKEHWSAMLTGMLDYAFGLDDAEQLGVLTVANQILDFLNIPDRGDPVEVPIQLATEAETGRYSARLGSGAPRVVRTAADGGHILPISTWRVAIQRLFQAAYPDLDPLELLMAAKLLDDLLLALGLPDRAAVFTPDHVWRSLPDS